MSENDAPRGPVAAESVPWTEWSEGARFGGKVRVLSDTRTPGSRLRIGVSIEELPLARVENQAYIHYQKGSLVSAMPVVLPHRT